MSTLKLSTKETVETHDDVDIMIESTMTLEEARKRADYLVSLIPDSDDTKPKKVNKNLLNLFNKYGDRFESESS